MLQEYYISEDRLIWVKEFYLVDAEDKEEARDRYYDGEAGYLGHTLEDAFGFIEAKNLKVWQSDAEPWVAHPESAAVRETRRLLAQELAQLAGKTEDDECFDDEVHSVATAEASRVNNEGHEGQILWLLERGTTAKRIRQLIDGSRIPRTSHANPKKV